jgi:hypothetical protein
VTRPQQLLDDVAADEAGRSGDQNPRHLRSLPDRCPAGEPRERPSRDGAMLPKAGRDDREAGLPHSGPSTGAPI